MLNMRTIIHTGPDALNLLNTLQKIDLFRAVHFLSHCVCDKNSVLFRIVDLMLLSLAFQCLPKGEQLCCKLCGT